MRRVYLDSCVLIYLVENPHPFGEQARQFLARNHDAVLCVSPLVRMEVLFKPLRIADAILVADYEDFMLEQRWLSTDDQVFSRALKIRAAQNLKTPDALHLATALHHGCDEFWTNDERLGQVAGNLAVDIFQPVG